MGPKPLHPNVGWKRGIPTEALEGTDLPAEVTHTCPPPPHRGKGNRSHQGSRKNPPEGKWLYFVVVDQSGTEAFAETYAEHVRNIELARSRGL